jgi:predicted nuclease of predicted toxin-antitoxin system
MRLLLDENITQKSVAILEKYGHDVIHVLDRFRAGESDEDVFRLAFDEQRALITLNGKDFVILIPPNTNLDLHYGLIWLRGFQVTNKTYEKVMDAIGIFLKGKGNSIKNTYYAVKKTGDSYEMIQCFPKVQR